MSRFVLLAPTPPGPAFTNVTADSERWNQLLKEAGRVRGRAYLADGAISAGDLDEDGAFLIPLDRHSWHILVQDDDGRTLGTSRNTLLPLRDSQRRGRLPHIGKSFERAALPLSYRVSAEQYLAKAQLRFGSSHPLWGVTGGWASTLEGAKSGPLVALALRAHFRLTGCACGLAIASERHNAVGQLMRTGCRLIHPRTHPGMFFDPGYGCHVGLVGGFAYAEPPSLRRIVDRIERQLRDSEVVTLGESAST